MEASLLCRLIRNSHLICAITRSHPSLPCATWWRSKHLLPHGSTIRRAFSVGKAIGQPIHDSHPHLIGPGELTKGIKKEEFKSRREKLISAMSTGSVAMFYSAPEKIMTKDIPYESHHSSQVSYLSGFQETNAILVLEKTGAWSTHKFYMFVRERDPKKELWNGPRAGTAVMVPLFGCDKAYNIEKDKEALLTILSKASTIYCNQKEVWPDMHKELQLDGSFSKKTRNNKMLDTMQLIKSPAELALMQEASTISGESFVKAMAFTRPGMLESFIHAKIEFECKMRGAQRLAYPPVVAGGANGLSLHYVNNTDLLRDGDLVMVDAGCEYHGYVSDITRTWPVGRKFSTSQKEVYEVVLECNKKCIELALPGASLSSLQWKASSMLREGLSRIGALKPFEYGTFDVLYPHMIGHYVGMDVHDCDSVSSGMELKPGMTVTIEPGLYIPPHPSVPERFHGIAVRIEDIVQITESGKPIVLTRSAPKEVSEIEDLRCSI